MIRMDVLVGIQHNYVIPCGVMLKSLVVNNNMDIICHAIINKDVSEADKVSLRKIVEDRKNNKICFYVFDSTIIDNYPGLKGTHFGESTYYRLFCSSILPSKINKVLYLDSDMIITSSLKELWEIEMGENAVAGVVNPVTDNNRISKYIDDPFCYINGGVQLINLGWWRKNHIEKVFVDFIKKDPKWIKFVDQDVLNAVLNKKIIMLPLKYNVQDSFLKKEAILRDIMGPQISELHEAILNPSIVHFSGSLKPWQRGSAYPYNPLYKKYLRMTEWKANRYMKEPYKNVIKRIARRACKELLILGGLKKELRDIRNYSQVRLLFK